MPVEELRRAKYPHMRPTEAEIWDLFLTKFAEKLELEKCEYDVHVGPGNVPEYVKKQLEEGKKLYAEGKIDERELRLRASIYAMAVALTQLRIDAVCESKHYVWIFEVKQRLGRSAIGQLLNYEYWYRIQFKPTKPIRLAVVCRYTDMNTEPLAKAMGIEVFYV